MKLYKLKILLCLVLVVTLLIPTATVLAKDDSFAYNKKMRAQYTSYETTLNHFLELDPNDNLFADIDVKKVKNLAKDITKNASTDYEKAKAIHNWVAENIWYDLDYYLYDDVPSSDNKDVNSILENKIAVCEGYSLLTVALHRAVGIPAMHITGQAIGLKGFPEGHAWCEVYVNKRWIMMDTTFDSNNSYAYNKFSEQETCEDTYFDCDLKKMSEDHSYFDIYTVPFGKDDYNRKDTSVSLPIGTTEILRGTFTDNLKLKKVILPKTMVEINPDSFSGCENLGTVILPKKLQIIGDSAFEACYKLKELTLPNTVTTIGIEAFVGCDGLTKIVIPSSVTKIGKNAFGKIEDGFMDDNFNYKTITHYPKNLVIYCEKDSVAHKYAVKNKIKFNVVQLPVTRP